MRNVTAHSILLQSEFSQSLLQESSTIPAVTSINYLTARSSISVPSRVTFCTCPGKCLHSGKRIQMHELVNGIPKHVEIVKPSFLQ